MDQQRTSEPPPDETGDATGRHASPHRPKACRNGAQRSQPGRSLLRPSAAGTERAAQNRLGRLGLARIGRMAPRTRTPGAYPSPLRSPRIRASRRGVSSRHRSAPPKERQPVDQVLAGSRQPAASLPFDAGADRQTSDDLGTFLALRILVPVGLALWAGIVWILLRAFT